jgi:hypothetical protein
MKALVLMLLACCSICAETRVMLINNDKPVVAYAPFSPAALVVIEDDSDADSFVVTLTHATGSATKYVDRQGKTTAVAFAGLFVAPKAKAQPKKSSGPAVEAQ